jgi:thiamine transport system substrate-binding protein
MKRPWALLLVAALGVAACGGGTDEPLRVLTHDSFLVSDSVLDAFTAETGIEVEILRGGDAGTVVSQAALVAGNPTADVLYGVDNTLLSRALDAGVFLPYRSPNLDDVPQSFHVAGDPVTPIDYGDVCLNYDKESMATLGLPVPDSLRALTESQYAGTLVVQNPATSSPGLAFMLASIAVFGEEGEYTWLDFWRELRANDVTVVAGWEQAYYEEFAGGGVGDLPLVVSYASSPPAGVVFAEAPIDVAPTASIDAGCFRQIEYAGVLDGADRPDAARRFIDFMLTPRFQEDMPLNMFVFPVASSAMLPDVFVDNVDVPQNAVTLDSARIEANRARWISEWTDVFR